MNSGLIVDLETTGVDPLNDKIIEVGLLEFTVTADGTAKITRMFSYLEDPEEPLSEDIKKITGLDDELLAGQKTDWQQVRNLMQEAAIVIAHNAPFDRSFIEQRSELNDLNLHWGCSVKHINWQRHGYKTRALNYLAADNGFVNPFAHRALFDCATTFRLIAPHLQELISRSTLKEYLVSAVGAPFAVKDQLKARQYRWNGEQRVWAKTIFEDEIEEERAFLREEIYQGQSGQHQEEVIS